MTPEAYEAKRQARYERLIAAAERAERESSVNWQSASTMADAIPFGQPILIGHYSEGRDRRYRARIESKHRKGYELHQKAESLRTRASAAKDNSTIFSDDPRASEKLTDKLEKLEKRQEIMKAANKLVRKNDRAGLAEMGFSEARIDRLFTPDFCGRLGFADYKITNNGANIRRIKERIESLDRHAKDETSEVEINGIRILDNTDENRVQIFFPGKPSEIIRTALKSHGFKWAPSTGAWQRMRSFDALYQAKQIIKDKTA